MGDCKMWAVALAVIAILIAICLVVQHREKFASEGGPAGGLLIGGSYIGHAMDSAVSPCVAVEPGTFAGALIGSGSPNFNKIQFASKEGDSPMPRESFNVREWDERANFTPNPHPLRELPYGHDMMGIRRKFTIDGKSYL